MTDRLRSVLAAPWQLAFLVTLLMLAVPVHADPQVPAQQRQTKQKLEAVRARIEQLTEQQHQATARRDQLNRKLVQQARALDKAAAALHASDTQLQQLEQRLHDLDQQQAAVQERLDHQQEALAELLRATYKLGHGSDLRMLLGHVARCPPANDQAEDADCAPGERALAKVQRALAYSRYFQADRARKIRTLLKELAARREISQQIAAQRLSIQQQRETRRQHRDALQAEREKQRQLLARAEADIKQRGESIHSLEQDRKSLQGLLEQLRDVFADIPSTIPDDIPFSQRRGKLPWPVAGTPRKQKDGILIAVKAGTQVHAVAHGRVAYADWLRGYGMLLIIDHGNGWMSLYGGNESLLHSVGDWVSAGDKLATSGRGESSVAGLYFGLRHKGHPVDPGTWLKKR
ncbi:MAG: peptidoglycan DD-metalloendopeptidase family protein [Rhodanobacteraceae bacterium]